ncbi:MAG: 5-bromo-4-chloroindolyl phosphate hydrolysis family protein [Clostridia bacterium]|nr:5-bromo-4-chloroindolyl phosphate hydrolysis family protein [Clostridia bacterium]
MIPSLVIGATAFGAGELLLSNNKKEVTLKESDRSLYEVLETAKAQNKEILNMIPNIEDEDIRKDLNEIHETVDKIIFTISTKPNKKKKVKNFFDYYLPVTIKILNRYDEIENQRLSSDEGNKFMAQAKKMISEINAAFKKQLANLYQSDLVDADAEMKVFDAMLKADGFDSTDFNL